jgi:hypothetical protein
LGFNDTKNNSILKQNKRKYPDNLKGCGRVSGKNIKLITASGYSFWHIYMHFQAGFFWVTEAEILCLTG